MNSGSALLRRRWPAVALIASLLLNGFLIGLFATDFLRPHRGGFSGERFARFELRRFDDRLPKPAVDKIAAALVPLAPALDPEIAKLRGIRAEIMRLAAEPSPDRVAIDAKLAELRAQSAAMQEALQKATYDALLSLPPDQRARLGEDPRD
jgi:signal transduction histidine kinase